MVETESTLHVLQSSKVEWTEESRLDKTWTTRAKDNGGAERRSKSKRGKGRERWRGGAGSAVAVKGSESENQTMLAHRRLFSSDMGKHQCTQELKAKVPAAALGVLGCSEPPQDQRLGFCLALWLLSIVRRITASCRAFGHKRSNLHETNLDSI